MCKEKEVGSNCSRKMYSSVQKSETTFPDLQTFQCVPGVKTVPLCHKAQGHITGHAANWCFPVAECTIPCACVPFRHVKSLRKVLQLVWSCWVRGCSVSLAGSLNVDSEPWFASSSTRASWNSFCVIDSLWICWWRMWVFTTAMSTKWKKKVLYHFLVLWMTL